MHTELLTASIVNSAPREGPRLAPGVGLSPDRSASYLLMLHLRVRPFLRQAGARTFPAWLCILLYSVASMLFAPALRMRGGPKTTSAIRHGGTRSGLPNDLGKARRLIKTISRGNLMPGTGSIIAGLRPTGSCSQARAVARPSTRRSCSAAPGVSSTVLRWSIRPTSAIPSTGSSRGWRNHSGPGGSAGTALPPPPRRSPRRLAARTHKNERYRKVHARPWRIASLGRGDMTSSSSCGARALPMITNTSEATPLDNSVL